MKRDFSQYFKMRRRDPATGKPIRPGATPPSQSNAAAPPTATATATATAPAAGSAAQPAAPAAAQAPAATSAIANDELARRRETLTKELAEQQWDLGGLAYEMAIRDHFRLDLLVRQAARLQTTDAELAAIERMLRMEQSGAAGSCPTCGAPYSRGSQFCWQCGKSLMPAATAATAPAPVPATPAAQPATPAAQGTPTTAAEAKANPISAAEVSASKSPSPERGR